jgi:hypothetical protein
MTSIDRNGITISGSRARKPLTTRRLRSESGR